MMTGRIGVLGGCKECVIAVMLLALTVSLC